MSTSFSAQRNALARDLAQAFEDAERPWLPSFAPRLASQKWVELRTLGIGPRNYGTTRVRSADPSQERDVRAALNLPEAFGRGGSLLVETLRKTPAARYVELGLDLAEPDLAASEMIAKRIAGGLMTLARSPSIASSVGPLLRVLHVAIPEGSEYDVSFSDPEVPFSIFVGISPDADDGPVARLRLAEGILHEVMHLQLTLIEDVLPLVADEAVQFYSPWQDARRPVRGVLHGSYVFAVIRELMRAIRDDDRSIGEERVHAIRRIDTIDTEIAGPNRAMLNGDGLSKAGRRLVERCLL